MTKKLIALLDADGVLYAAALEGQIDCDGSPLVVATVDAVYKRCMQRVEDLLGKVEKVMGRDVDDAFLCLSDRRNFRYDILPSYKSNRKPSARPLLLDGLRSRVADDSRFKVLLIEGLEADDTCGVSAGAMQAAGRDTVIISPDKDLGQIPGYWACPLRDGTLSVTEVTREIGDRFHMKQTLTGDTVDGYKGLPGYGDRKAGDLLDSFEVAGLDASERWATIVDCYIEKGLTLEDALVQARVSKILRFEDWDTVAKEPRLFVFPEMVTLQEEAA